MSIGLRVYSPPEADRIWLWVYFNNIPIYPVFYLLKGDYEVPRRSVRNGGMGLRARFSSRLRRRIARDTMWLVGIIHVLTKPPNPPSIPYEAPGSRRVWVEEC